jgi:glucose-6-phosphate 1-epimerase
MTTPRDETIAHSPDGAIRLEAGAGGRPCVTVETALCRGTISLYGAQVLEWQPRGQAPVLWLSPTAIYADGTAIRGGIPICFPWFGAPSIPPIDPTARAHGLARLRTWELRRASLAGQGDGQGDGEGDRGVATVELRCRIEGWDATLTARLGDTLSTTLTIENMAPETQRCEAALHSYFAVGDIREVTVAGLEGAPFEEMTSGRQMPADRAPVRFEGEVDRLYAHAEGAVTVHDPVLARHVVVEKRGSRSTVVWNPWVEKASRMRDLGDPEWRRMVCIEVANVRADALTLAPGEHWSMTSTVRVEQD